MKLKSSNEIQSRTVKLHDQLDLFMLGVANTFPDLMKTVRDLYDVSYHLKYYQYFMLVYSHFLYYLLLLFFHPLLLKCGSKSMEKNMNQFIAMVNVGTAGLAFYDRVIINNKTIFNG